MHREKWLLVMGELDAMTRRVSRDAPPLGDAAHEREIRVDDVDGAALALRVVATDHDRPQTRLRRAEQSKHRQTGLTADEIPERRVECRERLHPRPSRAHRDRALKIFLPDRRDVARLATDGSREE